MAKNDINSREYYVLSISIVILRNFFPSHFFSFPIAIHGLTGRSTMCSEYDLKPIQQINVAETKWNWIK